MGQFRRGYGNILWSTWGARERLGKNVRVSLAERIAAGLATGRPRCGEIAEGEGYRTNGGRTRYSSRRYVGLDPAGEQIIQGRKEGLTERQLAALVNWPRSSIHSFLARNRWRLGDA